jgi:AAA15 family ATPase/GTPase
MIREFTVKNFRGFQDFSIDNLSQVNLIAGKNNVGKSALLEALFLHFGNTNPQLAMQINGLRGMRDMTFEFKSFSSNPFDSLFFNLDHTKIIELNSIDQLKKQKSVRIRLNPISPRLKHNSRQSKNNLNFNRPPDEVGSDIFPVIDFEENWHNKTTHYQLKITPEGIRINRPMNPEFETHFIPSRSLTSKEDAILFGKIDRSNYTQIDEIVKILQTVDNRIKRLSVIPNTNDVMIHADIGLSNSLPLPLMGEGMGKLTSILLRFANARNGVVIIDEIENGFHHSILKDIWKVIFEAAIKFNVQIFATTHSYECIKAVNDVLLNNPQYDFALHRLVRYEDGILHKTLNKEKLSMAIESNLEVR